MHPEPAAADLPSRSRIRWPNRLTWLVGYRLKYARSARDIPILRSRRSCRRVEQRKLWAERHIEATPPRCIALRSHGKIRTFLGLSRPSRLIQTRLWPRFRRVPPHSTRTEPAPDTRPVLILSPTPQRTGRSYEPGDIADHLSEVPVSLADDDEVRLVHRLARGRKMGVHHCPVSAA